MDAQNLLDNIQELSDLELCILLSLVGQGHCLVTTDDDLVDDLASELSLIATQRFGLSCAVLDSESLTSVDRFGDAILEEKGTQFSAQDDLQPGSLRARLASLDIKAAPRPHERKDVGLDNRMIKNVIIAKRFNFADQFVQVQAIEIINNKRLISHTTVHITPKTFLFIPVVPVSTRRTHLIPHLNDRIFVSHYHLPEHGFPNLEEPDHSNVSENSSGPSKQRLSWESTKQSNTISKDVIDKIRAVGEATGITPEVRRYMQDIVTFLRLDRAVDGGISPRASIQFVALAKYLAPLHGINFVTPSLVALAARKVYPHRIAMAEPKRERSMQYGSDFAAVSELLNGITPQDVIEEVLNTVPGPI